jgi:hypothetical protein
LAGFPAAVLRITISMIIDTAAILYITVRIYITLVAFLLALFFALANLFFCSWLLGAGVAIQTFYFLVAKERRD